VLHGVSAFVPERETNFGSQRSHFHRPRRHLETNGGYQVGVETDWEVAVNAIVANVLMHEAARAKTSARPFKIIALFCGVGLLASLCMASMGFDLSAGSF
jgi:tRNA/tmRNA/rRNA uracil-C5-methylase (TrmA/RlmC/RlmD family)